MADYYASQSGGGDGLLPTTPWSIGSVNWTTVSGNTLYILDTITSTITPTVGGVSDAQRTTIRGDYPDRTASLESTAQNGIAIGALNNITIKNISNISPATGRPIRLVNASSNLTVDNCVCIVIGATANAIMYDGHGSNIQISNNTVTGDYDAISVTNNAVGNISNVRIHGNTVIEGGRHAIHVFVDPTDTFTMSNIRIFDNTILATGGGIGGAWGSGNGIRVGRNSTVNGDVLSDIEIYNNTVSNTGGVGIFVGLADDIAIYDNVCNEISLNSNGQGIGVYGSSNFKVYDNVISNVYTDSATYDGHGIDLDFLTDAVTVTIYHINDTGSIFRNKISNCHGATRTPGINILSCLNIYVYSNTIYNCTNGFKIGRRSGTAPEWWENIHIHNNTIIGGTLGNDTGILIQDINALATTELYSCSFKNNIIIDTDVALYIEDSDTAFTIMSNSCYYNNSVDEVNLGTGATNTTDNVLSDPLLDSNYKPRTDSPCVGAGAHTGLFIKDMNGAPFKRTTPTIGAYERKTHRGVA